jgi:hypothetical protein
VAAEWENHVPKVQQHSRRLFQPGGLIADLATVGRLVLAGGVSASPAWPSGAVDVAVLPKARGTHAAIPGTHGAIKASNPI